MLIIGHRGAAGIAPENTLEGLSVGYASDADMLEFDVRLTADLVPILSHDARMHGAWIRRTKLRDLQSKGPVTTLESVLDTFFGRILLNLELKPIKDVRIVYDLIARKCIRDKNDWDNIIISTFHVRDLFRLRKLNPDMKLAMLLGLNPFAFVTYQRRLRLSAVGWHRLHVNNLAIEIAKKADIFTYVYTVNKPDAVLRFRQRGIDGVVTDYPDRVRKIV